MSRSHFHPTRAVLLNQGQTDSTLVSPSVARVLAALRQHLKSACSPDHTAGKKYRVPRLRRTLSAGSTRKNGVIEVSEVSEEAPLPNGITRFEYAGGWVSDKASDGRQILELLEDDDDPVE
jgi:hypothetical protein